MIHVLIPLLTYFKKDSIKHRLLITTVVNDAVDELVRKLNKTAKIQFNKNHSIIIIRHHILAIENKIY
jgi:hypothetical protein